MHTLSSVSPTLASWLRMVHRDPERRRREVFLSTTEIGSTFFQCVSTVWRVIINEKNGRSLSLSFSVSPPPVFLHFRFRSRDRDARCSAAYRAPACFFAPFLSPWQTISPLFTSLRGGMVSFARGEKEGRGKSRSRLALLATLLSFRMKKSG